MLIYSTRALFTKYSTVYNTVYKFIEYLRTALCNSESGVRCINENVLEINFPRIGRNLCVFM